VTQDELRKLPLSRLLRMAGDRIWEADREKLIDGDARSLCDELHFRAIWLRSLVPCLDSRESGGSILAAVREKGDYAGGSGAPIPGQPPVLNKSGGSDVDPWLCPNCHRFTAADNLCCPSCGAERPW